MISTNMAILIALGTLQTLYMTLVSTAIAYVIGVPLGVLLFVTSKGGIAEKRAVHLVLAFIVNVLRSVPFLILLVALLPVTRAIVGTSLGSTATIVPLVVGSAPYVARLVESSLKEVSPGVIEAARSMGSTPTQIVTKVLVPEAAPSLLVGACIALATILGYSAMAGFVGGGGLGAIAIMYGYYRYQTGVMLVTVALLVIIVQLFQEGGLKLVSKMDKRRRQV